MSIDHFSSATAMRAALDARELSARELAELHIRQIEGHDKKLNAIPVRSFDRALEAADRADERLGRGEQAPLLGLPMTLKESTQVAGLPQTAGIEAFKGYAPEHDGLLAERVFAAGAGLLGKTNIPMALSDWQADSPVYGRTGNPWDLSRTPGGSTGGGGAAVAAGMTPLEVGSDIGGSIRVPATYCGVFGHRPSETAIARSGAYPLADLPNPAFLMAVQGPLARTADDLKLLFDVLTGPDIGERTAWRLELPPPRAKDFKGLRVALMPEVLDSAPSAAVRERLEALAALLSEAGAAVDRAAPDFDMAAYYEDYLRCLSVMMSLGQTREEREAQAAAYGALDDGAFQAQAEGLTMDAQSFLELAVRREQARAAWARFFEAWDVVLAPMTLDSAFPHQEGPMSERTLLVDNVEVSYFSNITFPMVAIFAGLPSTAFPAGFDSQGLPLGLQLVGPYLEDRTTLGVAGLIEAAWQGFVAPPGY